MITRRDIDTMRLRYSWLMRDARRLRQWRLFASATQCRREAIRLRRAIRKLEEAL